MTLTELMVVVGIIVLVLGLAVPAISVWESRKVQDAINLTSALLARTQARALTEKKTQGLFFFVDPESQAQLVWPIQFEPRQTGAPGSAAQTADRFVLRDTEPFKLPKPMRVVPVSVVDAPDTLPPHLGWSADQLADPNLRDPSDSIGGATPENDPPPPAGTGEIGTQYHRNFFVVLFDGNGSVLANQRAFIVDNLGANPPSPQPRTDECGPSNGLVGLRTGLVIRVLDPASPAWDYSVIDCNNTPILFSSTSGVLIYNDDAFRALPPPSSSDDEHRDFLRQLSQPLYIHAVTGRIIKGKPGEAT